jgi:pimeloyl-ACP methyl ester carboxylesterase
MPAVLVHGNPETPAVWAPLQAALSRDDVLTPQLPGFGVRAPDGFEATKEEYVEWLTAELEAVGEPVDLVGHDWGGAFVLRIACTRPDLVRTWASDVAGLLDPDFVWHDFAQIWQTPGAGEEWVASSLAQPRAERAAQLQAVGVTPEAASAFVDAFDEEMGRCILALYRSAAQPAMNAWGRDAEAAAARPGLVLAPGDDPFTGDPELVRRAAAKMGARLHPLPGLGHWWLLHDPASGAQALEELWESTR